MATLWANKIIKALAGERMMARRFAGAESRRAALIQRIANRAHLSGDGSSIGRTANVLKSRIDAMASNGRQNYGDGVAYLGNPPCRLRSISKISGYVSISARQ